MKTLGCDFFSSIEYQISIGNPTTSAYELPIKETLEAVPEILEYSLQLTMGSAVEIDDHNRKQIYKSNRSSP